ncbi:MAG: LysM peptidoglycan-binding domain-containing protein [Chloroflexi bacterium]|nr:LysM peptidoglycan-binding domain-containing protein [Chloroflexota bacterium]
MLLYSCGGGDGKSAAPTTAGQASLQATVQAQATLIAQQATTIAQLRRGATPEAGKPDPTPAPPQSEKSVYVVQPGDNLNAIAQQFGVTVEAIVKANGLADPNVLSVGQSLNIPPKQ